MNITIEKGTAMDADVIRRFKAREKAQKMWRAEMGASHVEERILEDIVDELVDDYEKVIDEEVAHASAC